MASEIVAGCCQQKSEVQLKNANETQGLCDVSAISSKCAFAKFPSDPLLYLLHDEKTGLTFFNDHQLMVMQCL